jgi:tRNA threonylcarbamoyl adenosine modification protein YeaZ
MLSPSSGPLFDGPILMADTSTPHGSVAIFDGHGKLLTERSWDLQESHSEIIITEIDLVLKATGLQLKDIHQFACGTGPGSFTGIRVAVNAIKTLAYVFQKPVITIDSLALLAAPALKKHNDVLCLQSAFRNLFYVSRFLRASKTTEAQILAPHAWTSVELTEYFLKDSTSDQGPVLVVGEAYEEFKDTFDPDLRRRFFRDPTLSDRPQSRHLTLGGPGPLEILQWFQVKALYVRASEAEEKVQKKVQEKPGDKTR